MEMEIRDISHRLGQCDCGQPCVLSPNGNDNDERSVYHVIMTKRRESDDINICFSLTASGTSPRASGSAVSLVSE